MPPIKVAQVGHAVPSCVSGFSELCAVVNGGWFSLPWFSPCLISEEVSLSQQFDITINSRSQIETGTGTPVATTLSNLTWSIELNIIVGPAH